MRKRLGRARAVATIVIVAFIVVAIVSAWWYYASPVEREGVLRKTKSIAINGAISSGSYALLALGFTLIYGVTEVVNMGYGALAMLGSYLFFALGPLGWYTKWPMLLALVLAIVLIGLVGTVFYRLTIHPVAEDPLAPIVTTIGIAIIIQQLIVIIFKADYIPVRFYVTSEERPAPIDILGTSVIYAQFWAFVASLLLFAALWIFVTKTKIGGAMRAVAQDREVAMLMGVNTERLYMLTMAISSSLAGLAGILITYSVEGVIYPYVWQGPLIMSFAIVILGGLGSIQGSLLGAFIIGYSENIVVTLHPEAGFLTSAIYLAIMVLVLLLRPKGLFGKRIELE